MAEPINENDEFYVSTNPHDMAREMLECRADRLLLIWRVLNRTYNDHLIKPAAMPLVVWRPLSKRFAVTDVASPVLSTINSATYGGKVTRKVKRAYNLAEVEKFMKEAKYDDFMPLLHRDAAAYGTAFGGVGRKARTGKASLVRHHPISTRIATSKTDVEDVRAVVVDFGDFERRYTDSGIIEKKKFDSFGRDNGNKTTLPNSNYGFVPVTIGRGRWMDACTPYGESLIWPAIEETKQITALMCDLMVLERSQSYSTLIIKGSPINNPEEGVIAPWIGMRFEPDTSDGGSSDAFYISPDAKIAEINDIIESKFERCATQCQVPVELFVRAKSGTMQGTGAAMLGHKPLYDLVIDQQRVWRDEVEFDLIARIDAFCEFEKTGQPQDLEKFRANLDVEIEFEHETHPAYNQAEVQTWTMMRDEGAKTDQQYFKNFNRYPGWEKDFETAKQERSERDADAAALDLRKMAPRGVGDGSGGGQD